MQFFKNKYDEVSISKIILVVLCVILVLFTVFSSFFTIKEQQVGVITTLGNPTSTVSPGPHFKIPFIQKVIKVDTTTRGFPVGYNEETNETVSSESTMITSDFNFVNADFYVEWRVTDPIKYIFNSNSPQEILKNIAQASIRNTVGNTDVESAMTTGKAEIQANVKELMLKQLELYDLGLQVTNVTVQDVEPPTIEVIRAFKNVEDAKLQMDTDKNDANAYMNEKIPAARAEADTVIKKAEATKTKRINEANALVAEFNAMYEEYAKNPTINKTRMFYDVIQKTMPNVKLIIDDSNSGVTKMYPIEPFN